MSETTENNNSANEAPSTNPAALPAADDAAVTTSKADAPTATESTTIVSSSTATTSSTTNSASSNMVFPCIEQPLRITLFCNGHYLWGIRRGNRVIARKRRSEKDEFRLKYTDRENGIVEIYHHKFGGALSVVVDEATGVSNVVCVPPPEKNADEKNDNPGSAEETVVVDSGETGEDTATEPASNPTDSIDNNQAEDPDETFDDEPAVDLTNTKVTEDDNKWCFIRGAHGNGSDGGGGTQVMLKSLRTGENLGVDSKGKVVLVTDTTDMTNSQKNMATPDSTTWDIDCVTGELCFLSNANPLFHRRVRCDMAGLLTLTEAWKGWEVFRLMEATHGYVKISSWMHSQWLLCSTEDGGVTTCSHAESMMEHNPKGCCQWAIEKYISRNDDNNDVSNSGLEGVIIRSKTHGRLLSVYDGVLKTYSETDIPVENISADTSNAKNAEASAGDINKPAAQGANNWWSNSVKSMKNMQRRMSSASLGGGDDEKNAPIVPQKETIVWQVEAAHLQTYYFAASVEGSEKPKTIGPFPYVTPNLRQNDKIQMKREGLASGTRLFEVEKQQYIACSAEGIIAFVETADGNPNTEWILDKPQYQSGGNVFRSKAHNLYLSYDLVMGEEPDTEAEAQPESHSERFNKMFKKKPEPVATLVGSETIGVREVWKLEPCMPRAVSSEKITTFAIGTSIAVGTTIAMPFALAGAGAILGAVGAEAGVLFNAIAVGLTGAEALASVGAIGATAYIVFRPEDNSLTDDHKNDDEDAAERAWSKRPFSNWRNW